MFFRDWRFRHKLLVMMGLPVGVAVLLLGVAFFLGVERVWLDAVSTQTSLERLDALSREYQSEIREYVLLREPETAAEVAEIEDEFDDVLVELSVRQSAAEIVVALRPEVDELRRQGRWFLELPTADASLQLSDATEVALERFEDLETALETRIDDHRDASEAKVRDAFGRFEWLMIVCGGIALLVALGVAIVSSRWIEQPIRVLQEASERLLDGDFRARDKVHGRDELGELAAGFDRGAAEIRRLLAEEQAHLDDLRRHQAQLVQSAKMAAVGELAAGVAHEINNPLSAVLTYSVLLREKAEGAPAEVLDHMPKLVDRLSVVERAAQRCKAIANNLLAFSRQEDAEHTAVHVAAVVDDALELTMVSARQRGLTVERRVEPSLPAVRGQAHRLVQVLVNLIQNAIQAIVDDGRIVVGARHVGAYCELTVEDDGPGLAEEIRDRLFEPFVTTKRAGEGTGLGLSIAYGIVRAHDGDIRVDSEPGRTLFTIELPLPGGEGRSA